MKYLYGASVQGIQGFIFQTNKLKEIVGASELIEQICTSKFSEVAGILNDDKNLIINAAGNIKYIFEDKTKCEHLVKIFPKVIMDFAPGITISQAVVPLSGDLLKDIDCLEQQLKAQRSKVAMPIETGFMGLERDRSAGGVAVPQTVEKDAIICSATKAKIGFSKEAQVFKSVAGKEANNLENLPLDIEKITESGSNSWLAIIHADGNALGILLQTLGKKLKENKFSEEQVKTAFSTFSQSLDTATKEAARIAFENVIKVDLTKYKYPIRPVILGGDDLTVIIRADLALDFTIKFLEAFEKETETQFKFLFDDYKIKGFENGITACAGIAYIKEKYPFHYGVHLAELLTGKAKKFSKDDKFKKYTNDKGINIPPSSISFYKVQSSFIESLDDMTEKTLTADISKVSFDYGPYLIKENDKYPEAPTVKMLKTKLDILENEVVKRDKSKAVSKLRQWISELYKDKTTANFMLDRMKVVNKSFYDDLKMDNEKQRDKTIIYDVIQLHSLKY
jgi:molybdopterin converting factor small subunit